MFENEGQRVTNPAQIKRKGKKKKSKKLPEAPTPADVEEAEALADAIAQAERERAQMRLDAVERSKAARHRGSLTYTDGTWRTVVLLQLRRIHKVLGLPPPRFQGDIWAFLHNSEALSTDNLLGFAIAPETMNKERMKDLLQESANT